MNGYLFDYERCSIRAWLTSGVVMTLCLGLAASISPWSSGNGKLLAGFAVGTSIFLLVGVPEPNHAFRGGVLSANAGVVATVVALPLGLGVWLFTAGRRAFRYAHQASALLTGAVVGGLILRFVLWGDAETRT